MGPESRLAAHVISWLESEGWDVYQEVSGVDIVALRGGVVWAVECKMVMSFDVLEQAIDRRADCHCSWVATPPRKKGRALASKICSLLGVGWMTVSKDGKVNPLGRPAFNRKATDRLRSAVRPEHKTFAAAGSSTGRSWTPFKETCRGLLAYVVANPGTELRDAVKAVKHHYRTDSSATRSLANLVISGVVAGLEARRIGKSVLLFPSTVR